MGEDYQELINFLVKELGVSIVPIIPGEKRPGEFVQGKWRGMMDWERYVERLPTDIELEHWGCWPLRSLGVLTGKTSGIIALDFDNRPEVGAEVEKLIPGSRLKKRGAKGFTAFYRYSGEKSRKWVIEGETVLELLSDGRQTLIPPSLHPTGIEYSWVEGDFRSVDLDELESLTEEHFQKIDSLFAGYSAARTNQTIKVNASLKGPATLEDVGAALRYIRPDDYHTWIKMGMAICSEFPGAEGFDLWNSWSCGSAKYNELEMIGKWASFKGVRDVNIASVFYEAQLNGFQNNGGGSAIKYTTHPIREIEVSELEKLPEPGTNYGHLAIPRAVIDSAPGVVGKIASWITETSIFPQPALALGASLAAVGALKAHRVMTETNLRTNVYVVGVAPSGGGKGRAMERIKELFDAAGLMNIFSGKPVSDSALLKSLRNNKGRRLLQWDELGLALQEMTSVRAAGYKSAILSLMMELFSSAGTRYHGKEYADHDDKMKRADINQPCLCVYGASVPSAFYESLSSSHVVDGFASRFIILETDDPYPDRREMSMLDDVPPDLVSAVQKIEQMPTNSRARGDLDEVTVIRPRVVLLNEGAKSARRDANRLFDENRKTYGKQNEAFGAVWSRAGEHLMKMALIVEDGESITRESVEWAREIVVVCVKNLCEVIMNQVADNQHQRSVNKILDMIRRSGREGIQRKALYDRTRFLKNYERDDILESLIEAERIEAVTVKGVTKNTILYIAR